MGRLVAMRAPTRVDFGGGWTDVPPYSEREGGAVCAMAITRYATARVTRAPTPASHEREAPAAAVAPPSPLVRAALTRAGLDDAGLEVRLHSDFPVGAGLGGSSAASAALLGALDRWRDVPIDRAQIAERGRAIEVEDLGIAGGRQDHYCATHGGLLGLTFGGAAVGVRRIALPAALRQSLERRCVIVYTGESRVSGDTILGVLDGYRRSETRVITALAHMRTLAEQMVAALEAQDVDTLGSLVGEHWAHQRALHPAISTPAIEAIIERAESAGALGSKATGASGGGCVVAVAGAGREPELTRALQPLGTFVTFAIDEVGLHPCDSNAATP
jgi:D-glycero-alpha-D-manno-heptose-7-phosphate kinase